MAKGGKKVTTATEEAAAAAEAPAVDTSSAAAAAAAAASKKKGKVAVAPAGLVDATASATAARMAQERAAAAAAAAARESDGSDEEDDDDECPGCESGDCEEHDYDDEDDEGEMLEKFWGVQLAGGKTITLALEGSSLHLTSVALAISATGEISRGAVSLVVQTNDSDATVPVAHLSAAHPHALLDLEFTSENGYVTLMAMGTAGLAVSGTIAAMADDVEALEDDEEEEGEEGEEGEDEDEEEGDSGMESGGSSEAASSEDDEEAGEGLPAALPAPIELPAAKLSATEKLKRKRAEMEGAAAPAPAAAAAAAPAPAPAAAAAKVARKERDSEGPRAAAAAAAAPAPKDGGDSSSSGLLKLAGGKVQYREVVAGMGARPKTGETVVVRYRGTLANGKEFDKGDKFTFKVGRGEVIKGWDVGVGSMAVGGRRTLYIHPDFGYGKRGAGPIPPNATLIFDVELLAVRSGSGGKR